MRYEALTLRELKSPSCLWLRVSHSEWAKFAVQSMDNGFPSIAGKVIYSSFCEIFNMLSGNEFTMQLLTSSCLDDQNVLFHWLCGIISTSFAF